MYAVGQGALAVECREDDSTALALLSSLGHCNTTVAAIAERAFMHTLQGGCSAPVAVSSKVHNITLQNIRFAEGRIQSHPQHLRLA